ncbi:pilus assembly protein [Tsuneonella sp. YG55]|uniref:Pilus assembly protein n=1 Tax=Tsuneonella litorea TaxID=2976475 RepID=A0A9X2VZR8_9SPHN|nr:TadE/TadG family type IV pilus assembly protein [Tsuneonella litorea]MCT2557998.1 pilus assembly protein [Tsuneonella litorea]
MSTASSLLGRVLRDSAATMAVETAVVAPVLALLALGGFEASSLVARKSELDSAVAEAAAIVRASPPADAAAREAIRSVVQGSIDPTGSNPYDIVTVDEIYRCGTGSYVPTKPTCAMAADLTTYIEVKVIDKYVPNWTKFGVGSPVDYLLVRRVLVA